MTYYAYNPEYVRLMQDSSPFCIGCHQVFNRYESKPHFLFFEEDRVEGVHFDLLERITRIPTFVQLCDKCYPRLRKLFNLKQRDNVIPSAFFPDATTAAFTRQRFLSYRKNASTGGYFNATVCRLALDRQDFQRALIMTETADWANVNFANLWHNKSIGYITLALDRPEDHTHLSSMFYYRDVDWNFFTDLMIAVRDVQFPAKRLYRMIVLEQGQLFSSFLDKPMLRIYMGEIEVQNSWFIRSVGLDPVTMQKVIHDFYDWYPVGRLQEFRKMMPDFRIPSAQDCKDCVNDLLTLSDIRERYSSSLAEIRLAYVQIGAMVYSTLVNRFIYEYEDLIP